MTDSIGDGSFPAWIPWQQWLTFRSQFPGVPLRASGFLLLLWLLWPLFQLLQAHSEKDLAVVSSVQGVPDELLGGRWSWLLLSAGVRKQEERLSHWTLLFSCVHLHPFLGLYASCCSC